MNHKTYLVLREWFFVAFVFLAPFIPLILSVAFGFPKMMLLSVFVTIGWFIMLGYRNNWVFNERSSLIWDDFETYKKLESYHVMFGKLWIWDVKKFVIERK